MDRAKEFEKVKKVIKYNIKNTKGGIFFSRNPVGDPTTTIFIGKAFTVDVCRYWGYYEVFGCTKKEAIELAEYYDELEVD